MAQGDPQDVRVFTGTTWHSITGPQGPAGADGPQGPQGEPGPNEVSDEPGNELTVAADGKLWYAQDREYLSLDGGEMYFGGSAIGDVSIRMPGFEAEHSLVGNQSQKIGSNPSIGFVPAIEDPRTGLACGTSVRGGEILVWSEDLGKAQYVTALRSGGKISTIGGQLTAQARIVIGAGQGVFGSELCLEAERFPADSVSGTGNSTNQNDQSLCRGSRWTIRAEPSAPGTPFKTPHLSIRDVANRSFVTFVSSPHRPTAPGPFGIGQQSAATNFDCDVTVSSCIDENSQSRRANFSVIGDVTFGPLGSFRSQGAATFKIGSINRDGIGPKIEVPVLANLTVNSTHANSLLMIGANVTVFAPDDATIPVGFECDVLIPGSSTCRLSAAAGVDLRYRTENKTGGLQAQVSIESPWGKAKLIKVASKVWYAEGTLFNASM